MGSDDSGCIDHRRTIIIGHLNIHHERWLKYSNGVSPEGSKLFSFCCESGFHECVKKPTRENHLLDLVLTDIDATIIKTNIHPRIADHELIEITLQLVLPSPVQTTRKVWDYDNAKWGSLRLTFKNISWNFIDEKDVDASCAQLTEIILAAMDEHIPSKEISCNQSHHSWINQTCIDLVAAKRAGEGTAEFPYLQEKCSKGLFNEYLKHIERSRKKLLKIKKGTKAWWKMSRALLNRPETTNTIPALRKTDRSWARTSIEKTELLQHTFDKKWTLPDIILNEFSTCPTGDCENDFVPVRLRKIRKLLQSLRIESSTGPDLIPARILKFLHDIISVPVVKLIRRILATGRWPTLWCRHWICPLYKKKSVYDPNNYRGLQIISQLSKLVERAIGEMCFPRLINAEAFGVNQFAYTPKRSARDAILYLVLTWMLALGRGKRIGIYCSDVSGAFDKVSKDRLLLKLKFWNPPQSFYEVVASWLRARSAYVVVQGETSKEIPMVDMVYQGTVWGPWLWNIFFRDATNIINDETFREIIFADDLNAFKEFDRNTPDDEIKFKLEKVQRQLHRWGAANQIAFDAGKESFHILSRLYLRRGPYGSNFRILGIDFDTKLLMGDAIHECVRQCTWKLQSILRTKRYYTTVELITLYKAHILSYIEYRTAAITHASATTLAPLDAIQARFLREINISPVEALMSFRLAPLHTRRDISMLGVLHRAAQEEGLKQLRDLFALKDEHRGYDVHPFQIENIARDCDQDYMSRTAFGYINIYNQLPYEIVNCNNSRNYGHTRESRPIVKSKSI